MKFKLCFTSRDEITVMSAQVGEAKNSHANDVDIGTFVHKYKRLVDLLSPMSVACDAILYIVR